MSATSRIQEIVLIEGEHDQANDERVHRQSASRMTAYTDL
jgi:hypothetical protein